MAQLANTINAPPWVAIDVSTFKHDILIEHPNRTHKKLKIMNTQTDYQTLVEALTWNGQRNAIAGFEATADYHCCLMYFLQTSGVQCHLTPSIAIVRTCEVMHQTWDKHDKKDTKVVLYLLKNSFTQVF